MSLALSVRMIPVFLPIKGCRCHWTEEVGCRLSLGRAALFSQPPGGSAGSSLATIAAVPPGRQVVLMEKNMPLLQFGHFRIFWENAEH